MRKKLLTLLVLLMTAVTGAWAQEQSETIVTTDKIVEGTHFTISNNNAYADEEGMNADGGITVTPKNGETITKVVISCTYHPIDVNDGNTSVSSGTKEITNGGATITVTGVNASTFTFTCSNDGPMFSQFVVYYTEASAGPAESIDLTTTDNLTWTLASMPGYDVELEVTYYTDAELAELAAKEALETAIAIATNINPEGLADAITAGQAALNDENATAESMAQAAQTLGEAIKAYFGEVLPNLGAIVTALNDETLNTAYANAQTALAKEDVTPQELAAAMQQVITAAQAVAPAHLQNLKGYAVKYGAEEAASLITLIDNALAAIEAGNVSQIITTMTAVKTAATPLAQTVLSTMIGYVQAFGLTEQAAQAQAALDGGNYITMITTAKALFTHLVAAAQEYLPKLGDIAEGLNDETLNTAYADAVALLAKESITPEELATAMQNIITAAQAVAPEHLQNLREYAVKYGAEDAVDKVDAALAAIQAGNVSQIIATMTAVKETVTPLVASILTQMIGYAQNYQALAEDVTAAQQALDGGNYITMIITAKALYAKLIAAAAEETVILADGDTYTRTLDMTVASATYKKSIAEERGPPTRRASPRSAWACTRLGSCPSTTPSPATI